EARITGTITPNEGTYRFGGGGGFLEIASELTDRFEDDERVARRSVEVHSPQWMPLTLHLTGANDYSSWEGEARTFVSNSALIFGPGSMPADGGFELWNGGYIGTEAPITTPDQLDAYIDRFSSISSGIIGFDSFNGSYTL